MAGKSDGVSAADASLRRAVLARLIEVPQVSTAHIRVAANGGRVTLSGYVTSQVQKDTVGAVTRDVKDVEQVTDDLLVAVPAVALPDLTAKVRPRFTFLVNPADLRRNELTP